MWALELGRRSYGLVGNCGAGSGAGAWVGGLRMVEQCADVLWGSIGNWRGELGRVGWQGGKGDEAWVG